MKDSYWRGKKGLYWIQLFETDRLARACPLDGVWVGPTFEARGETIEEAERVLIAKLQRQEA